MENVSSPKQRERENLENILENIPIVFGGIYTLL